MGIKEEGIDLGAEMKSALFAECAKLLGEHGFPDFSSPPHRRRLAPRDVFFCLSFVRRSK